MPTQVTVDDVRPGTGVIINSPGDLAGFLPATQWVGTAEVQDQTADLIHVGAGCSPLDYVGREVSGKIVLADQAASGTCGFVIVMQLAERAGAIGVVAVRDDNVASRRSAIASNIPGLELLRDHGAAVLAAAQKRGTTVHATLVDTPAPPATSPGMGVLVNRPEGLAGLRHAKHWSGTALPNKQTSDLVYAGTGCSLADYAAVDVRGKVALIDQFEGARPWEQCRAYRFQQKATAAETAGAIGLVEIRATDLDEFAFASAGIPVLTIARSSGKPLRQAVLQGETVNVTLVNGREDELDALTDIPCEGGRAGPFSCDGIDLLAFVPAEEFDGKGQSDLWGWSDPTTGDEYVMLGKTSGTALFRITDPANPVYLGEIANPGLEHLDWHDIKVFANHAFIVSESTAHGMLVFDLTRLRHVRDGQEPQRFAPDARYQLNFSAHNLALNTQTGFAYITGGNQESAPDQCLSGLHIVDVNEPKNPRFVGCHARDGGPGLVRLVGEPAASVAPIAYVHDTQCVVYQGPDKRYSGREICFNAAENKIAIVDVTAKHLPVTLGTTEYEAITYAHQGWLTEDHSFLLVNDELDVLTPGNGVDTTRTIVLDVRDLENPKVHFIHDHGTRASAHNNYVHEGLVYQSNYSSGLRVLDLDSVDDEQGARLKPLAFFDVFPDDDANPAADFSGTWSNYPYFDSGTIAVSGRQEGLFLLRLSNEDDAAYVTMACTTCPVDVRAGETGQAGIVITNDGRRDGVYHLATASVPDGWDVAVEPQQVTVPSGQSRLVTATTLVPRQQRAGTWSLAVMATFARTSEIAAVTHVPVNVVKGRPSQRTRS